MSEYEAHAEIAGNPEAAAADDAAHIPQRDVGEEDFFFDDFDINNTNCFLRFLCKFELFEKILVNYGPSAMLALSSIYFCIKGVSSGTTGLAYFPLLKDGFGVKDSTEQQQLSFIAQLAWPIKPCIGVLSDQFPVFGYRKRVYLTALSILGVVCLLGIYFLPTDKSYSVQVVVAFLFILNFVFAGSDLLCESTYSRYMVLRREGGTAIISYVWGLYLGAGVIAALLVGPAADAGESKVTMLALVPFMALAIYPLGANWLGERPIKAKRRRRRRVIDPEESNSSTANLRRNEDTEFASAAAAEIGGADDNDLAPGPDPRRSTASVRGSTATSGSLYDDNDNGDGTASPARLVTSDADTTTWYECALPCIFLEDNPAKRNLTLFALCMGVAAPVCAAVQLYTAPDGPDAGLYFTLVVVILLSLLSLKCLPLMASKAMIYMFLTEALYFSTQGPLQYWFTADEKCNPGGPAFSYTFYQTVAQIVSGIAGTLATVAFHKFLSKKKFTTVYIICTCLRVTSSLFDVFMVTRANKDIGISDHVAYIFGDAATYQFTYSLSFMPSIVLTSELCEPGLEATTYAVLAGFSNFGYVFAGTVGSALAEHLGIKTSSGVCDFTNLAPLILVSHCIFPLLGIPLAYLLIPDKYISSPLKKKDEEDDAAEETEEQQEGGASSLSSSSAAAPSAAAGAAEKGRIGEAVPLMEDQPRSPA